MVFIDQGCGFLRQGVLNHVQAILTPSTHFAHPRVRKLAKSPELLQIKNASMEKPNSLS